MQCAWLGERVAAPDVKTCVKNVILNKTGLDINIKAKSLLQQAKTAAGQSFHTDSASERRKALPYMFAFGADDQRNRVSTELIEAELKIRLNSSLSFTAIYDFLFSKPELLKLIHSNEKYCAKKERVN